MEISYGNDNFSENRSSGPNLVSVSESSWPECRALDDHDLTNSRWIERHQIVSTSSSIADRERQIIMSQRRLSRDCHVHAHVVGTSRDYGNPRHTWRNLNHHFGHFSHGKCKKKYFSWKSSFFLSFTSMGNRDVELTENFLKPMIMEFIYIQVSADQKFMALWRSRSIFMRELSREFASSIFRKFLCHARSSSPHKYETWPLARDHEVVAVSTPTHAVDVIIKFALYSESLHTMRKNFCSHADVHLTM